MSISMTNLLVGITRMTLSASGLLGGPGPSFKGVLVKNQALNMYIQYAVLVEDNMDTCKRHRFGPGKKSVFFSFSESCHFLGQKTCILSKKRNTIACHLLGKKFSRLGLVAESFIQAGMERHTPTLGNRIDLFNFSSTVQLSRRGRGKVNRYLIFVLYSSLITFSFSQFYSLFKETEKDVKDRE